ncbi:hypothetical protein GCM10029978_009880 [Actinoallomurus acanthiterrae]
MSSIPRTGSLLAAVALTGTVLLAGCGTAKKDEATSTAPPTSAGQKQQKAAKPVPVKLTAKRAVPKKNALADGALSCVKVTVTNQSAKKVEVNPLYFSITDTGGTKHDASDALGEYEGAIDTTTITQGEKATGFVCGKGKFRAKTIAMTDPLFTKAVRAEVG